MPSVSSKLSDIVNVLKDDLDMGSQEAQTLAQDILNAADLSVTDIFDMIMDAVAGLSWTDVMDAAVAIFGVLLA